MLCTTYRKSRKVDVVYKIYKENVSGKPVSHHFLQIASQATGISMSNSESFDLEKITSAHYLGVLFDSKRNDAHTDGITKKATKLLNLCCRNLQMCPAEVKILAYKVIARPHLEYASRVLEPSYKVKH